MNKADIYESVTNSIIEALEDGLHGEWSLPWHKFSDMPQNVPSGKSYRGLNVPMIHDLNNRMDIIEGKTRLPLLPYNYW